MTNDALMAKVRAAAEILRAKRDLRQQPMPAIDRLQAVARINRLRLELNHGRPAITSHNPKT